MEKNLDAFGSIFVDQAWSSYMDHLLSETNHMLSVLGRTTFANDEEIESMSDAELTVLSKNLSILVSNEDIVERSLKKYEGSLRSAKNNLKELRKSLEATTAYKVGLLEGVFALNVENLRNLPERFKRFRETFQRLRVEVRKLKELVEKEHHKRRVAFAKKRRKMIRTYPLIVVLSAVVASISFLPGIGATRIPLLVAALLPQLVYGFIYLLSWRSFHVLNKYPSWVFSQIQVNIFALVQGLYRFIATGDILTPSKTEIEQKSVENHEAV